MIASNCLASTDFVLYLALSFMSISPTEKIAGTQTDPCTPKASNFYHGGPSVTDWTKKRYRVPKTTRYFDRSPIYQIHTINDDGQTCSHILLAQSLTSTHLHHVSQLVPSNSNLRSIANLLSLFMFATDSKSQIRALFYQFT